jgi:hypothetical protein
VFLSYEAKLLRQFFDCGQHPLEKGGCRTVGAEHKLKLAVGIGGDPVGVFTGGSRGAEVEVDGTICIFNSDSMKRFMRSGQLMRAALPRIRFASSRWLNGMDAGGELKSACLGLGSWSFTSMRIPKSLAKHRANERPAIY